MAEGFLAKKIKQLPDFVKDNMGNSHIFNKEILDKFNLKGEDRKKVIFLMRSVILKELQPEELFLKLKQNLKSYSQDFLKKLCLEIFYKRFYPLRDYLPNLDNIILSLGGKIPQNIPLYSEIYKKKKQKKKKQIIKEKIEIKKPKEDLSKIYEEKIKKEEFVEYLPIKQAIEKYPEILKQFISAKPIKLKEFEEPTNPTVKNWIKDYIDNLGTGPHRTFERTRYLFNSENGKNLDSVDRNIVNHILKSYDENSPIPIDTKKRQIVITKLIGERNIQPEEVEPELEGNIINLKKKK